MSRWLSWSQRIDRPVNATELPVSLDELVGIVASTTQAEATLHAQGSRWAFEAPAYCPNVVVDQTELSGFPAELAAAVLRPDRVPGRHLVGVAAGTRIRDLYRALAFDRPRGYRGRTRSPYPAWPSIPGAAEGQRIWTLPVLGGAGGQSIAGAISSGTHGGDAARPPLSDAVKAIVMVGVGGELSVLEDGLKGEQVVDEDILSAQLGRPVSALRDADLFEAALLAVGRLGIIWAYVLEVHDETEVAIVETRRQTRWDVVRGTLVADARAAAAAVPDEFLQVVVEPIAGAPFKAYVTRHQIRPGNPSDEGAEPRLPHVARAREQSGCALAFQLLATGRGVEALHALITNLPILLDPAIQVRMATRLAEIGTPRPNGTHYIAGDATADILNDLTAFDPGWVVLRTLADILVSSEQRDHITHPGEPWEVKGTRFEIADFYNYDADDDGYRGESVEVFFPVDDALPDTIDEMLAVFGDLQQQNLPVAGYFSIRFMARSRATLGLARWPLSCSVEVAALRGTPGVDPLIHRLERITHERGGTVHWGQRNGLDPRRVRAAFGPDLDRWHAAVRRLDPIHLFSNPFSTEHGLDPPPGVGWQGWHDLGQIGVQQAAIPSGGEGDVEVFARGLNGRLSSVVLDSTGQSTGAWNDVQPEPGVHPPALVADRAGGLDLFEVDQSGWLRHSRRDPSDTTWQKWDVKGFPSPGEFSTDSARLSATAHDDGRIEVFGRAAQRHSQWLAHTWEHGRDGLWTTVHYRGDASLGQPPAATRRRQPGRDVLVVAGLTSDQSLVTRQQVAEEDDADWSDWTFTAADQLPGPPAVGPLLVAALNHSLRLFYIDALGHMIMGLDVGSGLEPVWSFTELSPRVSLSPLPTAASHEDRTWLVARSQAGELLSWDFEADRVDAQARHLDATTTVPVAIGGIPGTRAIVVVSRREDGNLIARRLEPSP